jgi:hypothetical protein
MELAPEIGADQRHVGARQDAVLDDRLVVRRAQHADKGERRLLPEDLLHQPDGFLRLVAVVVGHQADAIAGDAAVAVDVVQIQIDAGADGLAAARLGAGKCRHLRHENFLGRRLGRTQQAQCSGYNDLFLRYY